MTKIRSIWVGALVLALVVSMDMLKWAGEVGDVLILLSIPWAAAGTCRVSRPVRGWCTPRVSDTSTATWAWTPEGRIRIKSLPNKSAQVPIHSYRNFARLLSLSLSLTSRAPRTHTHSSPPCRPRSLSPLQNPSHPKPFTTLPTTAAAAPWLHQSPAKARPKLS